MLLSTASRTSRAVAAALAAALLSACGSTVPTSVAGAAGAGTAADGITPLAAADGSSPELGVPGTDPAADVDDTGAPLTVLPGGAAGPAGANVPGAPQQQPGAAPLPAGQAAPAPGTRNTSPLKVGITYIDNSGSSAALGVDSNENTNGRNTARAMVAAINKAGGLAGRKLVPVEYAWNSQSTNYSQDASVACEKFSKDEPVQVVLDGAFGTTGGFGACLQKASILQITRGPEGDSKESRSRPLHVNPTGMTDDRAYGAAVSGLADSGYLSSKNQLGIVLEDCPSIRRAYAGSVRPLIAKLGLKEPLVRTIECVTSFSSAGPASSAISGAVLAFRQGGVDRVMFVSDYESVALLLFSNNASSQGYRPGYALTSNGQAALRPNLPKDQWAGLHGVGSSPSIDVEQDATPTTATEKRCLQLAKSGGVVVGNRLDTAFVYGSCALFLLLETSLQRTGGDSRPAALMAAVDSLGTAFTAPGVVTGRTRITSEQHDGVDAVREFGYVDSCTCMRYLARARPAPA